MVKEQARLPSRSIDSAEDESEGENRAFPEVSARFGSYSVSSSELA